MSWWNILKKNGSSEAAGSAGFTAVPIPPAAESGAVGTTNETTGSAPAGNRKADAAERTERAGDGEEIRKEKKMDIKAINGLIDNLKENLDDGLIFTEISSFKVGSSLAGYNMKGKFGTLINKYTKYIIEIVNKVGFSTTCEYYAVDIAGDMCMFVLVFEEYCWPILINTKKVALGMMVSAVLPDCIRDFEKTMK